MTKETQKPRPWALHKKFSDYESADAARKKLEDSGLEVRVRRRPQDETFDVKKRTPIS